MTSHILLIEPSKLYQQIIGAELGRTNLKVVIATSAQSALEKVKRESFLLILCANQLPDSDGISLAGELRQFLKSAVPILLLAADDNKELIHKALVSEVTEVIQRGRMVEMSTYITDLSQQVEAASEMKANILYLEDSPSLAMQTEAIFSSQGYQMTVISQAEDAALLISENNYDLVITDILLAGQMTGIALIREIRAMPEPFCSLPILAISGLDKASQKVEALKQGASDFVTKPVDYEELLVRSHNLIRSKRLADKVREQERHLKSLATTDSLTGLYNRHYLAEVGMKRVTEAIRHQQALSLVIVDLDFFKKINDTHGHGIGDLVLKEVGQLMKDCCRQEDFAVRFGGEEFILVLPHCGPADAKEKALRIRQQIKALNPNNLPITASFGVAGKSKLCAGDTFEKLFHDADEAVYYSKEHGRDRVSTAEMLSQQKK